MLQPWPKTFVSSASGQQYTSQLDFCLSGRVGKRIFSSHLSLSSERWRRSLRSAMDSEGAHLWRVASRMVHFSFIRIGWYCRDNERGTEELARQSDGRWNITREQWNIIVRVANKLWWKFQFLALFIIQKRTSQETCCTLVGLRRNDSCRGIFFKIYPANQERMEARSLNRLRH